MSNQNIVESQNVESQNVPDKAPVRRDWRIPDELWERLEPLIPSPPFKPHPLGCHRQRIPNRQVMDGIFFVLRTG